MKVNDLTHIALCVVLMIICAWITIPMVIPVTMQVFAVALTANLLGGKKGLLAVIVYIFMGAAGLPVFSGMRGGFGVLLGNTGGYIIGYIVMVLIIWAFEGVSRKFKNVDLIAMILGLIGCYVLGTVWFVFGYAQDTSAAGIKAAVLMCVVPYVIPDLIKLFLARTVCQRLKKYIL